MTKKVVIVGAGFAGLSSAAHLAQKGLDVTVVEKNNTPGGRARKFEAEGFTFDMGPSWYWMPDTFERFFNQFGKKVADYYELVRLDPSYRIFFEQEQEDIPAKWGDLVRMFERWEKGSGHHLEQFMKEAAYKYEVGVGKMVHKPGRHLSELLDGELIKGVLKLHIFTSFSKYIRKYFKDPRILQLLEFPVLFLGAMPQETPALYSLMNYADMKLGTWYPMNGMHEIVKAMVSVAKSQGAKFIQPYEVRDFTFQGNRLTGVTDGKTTIEANVVINAGDYHHLDGLLPEKYRNYSEKYWQKRTMAPSSLLYYVGVDKKIEGIKHHNLFFDTPFGPHAQEIYKDPKWPEDPLFYLCAPSKTDPSVAPEGCENLFFLIPVAPGMEDTEEIREHYFDIILKRLEERTGQQIKDHIIYKRAFAHNDFVADYHAFKGNAYGLANTLRQTANLKPSLYNKTLPNLFYTGQLTVPGPGVPPSIISGEVVAKEVLKLLY